MLQIHNNVPAELEDGEVDEAPLSSGPSDHGVALDHDPQVWTFTNF